MTASVVARGSHASDMRPFVHVMWPCQVHVKFLATDCGQPHSRPMNEDRISPESQEAIGRRLRETREALELSPRQFYEAVGFSKTQLENYEAGRRLMKPAMAIRVITTFTAAKLDFNWLYHGDLGGTAHDFAQAVLSRREKDRAAGEAA